jgi:PAS domain S-box-containing protein
MKRKATHPRSGISAKPGGKRAAARTGEKELPIIPLKTLASDGLLSRILDIADDAIVSVDRHQRIVLFNKGAEKIFRYGAEEVIGKPLSVLLPTQHVEAHKEHIEEFGRARVAARRMGEREQIAGRRKDGVEFPAEASISKVEVDGRRIFTVILRDMTQHKETEEQIRTSLREKEVLLKEIHHRVKNNLQVVSSLLSLQVRGIGDEGARQAFRESQDRVLAMALIHEQLYQSKDLSDVRFGDYIRQLAAHLFRSYQVSASRIELKTDIEDVHLPVDTAVHCGLIINELVSNALKHAFPNGREGEIRIELKSDSGMVLLSVEDNGVGIPDTASYWSRGSLGLRLVKSLVRQLQGETEVGTSRGASIRIRFAQPEPE